MPSGGSPAAMMQHCLNNRSAAFSQTTALSQPA